MTWTYLDSPDAELPPMDVPVVAVFTCGDDRRRFVGTLARGCVDGETWGWGQCYDSCTWLSREARWDSDECLHDDDYRVIAWHPLPDPTTVLAQGEAPR